LFKTVSDCHAMTFARISIIALMFTERLKFKPIPVNARLELGASARVACRAEGRVTPLVRWYSGDVVGGLSARLPAGVRDSDGVGDLTFDPVDRNHAGTYTCVATSEQGSINASIRVDVVGRYPSNTRNFNIYL
jgi:PTK7 protein tyrosine kinase 7